MLWRKPHPPLLLIFRSRQQVELLALILGDPKAETSISDLSARLGIRFASVHREVERAERAGVLTSRKIGNTRLVRADTRSPYFDGLSAGLVRAFGVPAVLGRAMSQPIHQTTVLSNQAEPHAQRCWIQQQREFACNPKIYGSFEKSRGRFLSHPKPKNGATPVA
jgi:hypothetical protein